MNVLKNPRHELFVKFIAGGASPSEAMVSAGYSKTGAAGAAQRLLKNVAIATRLNELQQEIVKNTIERVSLSREWVLQSMKLVAERCLNAETFNAAGATRSLELLGKELGLFRDRVDHTMQWDGDPSKLTGAQLAKLKQQLELLAFNGDAEAMEKFKREMQGGGKVIDVKKIEPSGGGGDEQ